MFVLRQNPLHGTVPAALRALWFTVSKYAKEFHLDYVTLRNMTSLRYSRYAVMFSWVVEDNTRGVEWRGCKKYSTFAVFFQSFTRRKYDYSA